MTRATRVVALVMGLSLSLVPGRAEAQNLTLRISSAAADRGATVCTPVSCSNATVVVPKEWTGLEDRHVCPGTSLADTGPSYRCSVFVGASLFGRPVAKNVPVTVTFEITSDDGAPWGDDVRRAMRGQTALMQPPAGAVPAPCSAVPAADSRVSCSRVGPRTWKVSATTRSRTGLFVLPLLIEFPSSTGTEPACEYLRLKGTAKSAGQTVRADLGRRRYCA